jgi:hypothetical protein
MSAKPVRAFAEDRNVAAWQLEVSLFWALGIVVMILSGAVAICATHLHLWVH